MPSWRSTHEAVIDGSIVRVGDATLWRSPCKLPPIGRYPNQPWRDLRPPATFPLKVAGQIDFAGCGEKMSKFNIRADDFAASLAHSGELQRKVAHLALFRSLSEVSTVKNGFTIRPLAPPPSQRSASWS